MLDRLLGNDLLGFHLRYHCKNFLDCVDRTLEAKVDYERYEVTRRGKVTLVRPFPISIDYDDHQVVARSVEVEKEIDRWTLQLGVAGEAIAIGIDRIDYTKGIPERLRAFDRLLEKYPKWREKIIFVQIGVPSRTHVRAYQQLDDEVDGLVEEINWRWSTDSWKPIVYLKQQYSSGAK